MKKKLKILLIVGIVILLSIISFIGVYAKNEFKYENKVPDYKLVSNLDKITVVNLKVDDTTEQVKYDENGNKVEDTDSTESEEEATNYTTVDEPVNKEENLNVENYKKSKEIIEKRLHDINLPEYIVRLDEETGNIQIQFQDDVNVYAGSVYSTYLGKVEITDSQTNDVILTNDDIKDIKVGYQQLSSGYEVYLNADLNKEGQEKLQNLINSKQNNNEEETENTEETANETTETENTTSENTEETTGDTEATEETEEKNSIAFKFEDEEVATVNLEDINSKSTLKVVLGTSTSNTQINSYLNQGAVIEIMTNSGKMPIKYTMEDSKEVQSIITNQNIQIAIYVLLAIYAVINLYIIIKYKKNGLAMLISNIGLVAILMLIIRYTNVLISYEAITAFLILEIIIGFISIKILEKQKNVENEEDAKKQFNKACMEIMNVLILLLVISVVFTFINWTAISSIGMIMFWGLISTLISTGIFARTLLIENARK